MQFETCKRRSRTLSVKRSSNLGRTGHSAKPIDSTLSSPELFEQFKATIEDFGPARGHSDAFDLRITFCQVLATGVTTEFAYYGTVPIALGRVFSAVIPEFSLLQDRMASPTGTAKGCNIRFAGRAA